MLYEGEVGPQHVGWFWQPESRARIPDGEKIFFDRVGLPVALGAEWRCEAHRPASSSVVAGATRIDVLTHKIMFLWAMSLIVAKYIDRRKGETVGIMTTMIARTLQEAVQLLGSNVSLPGNEAALRSPIESESPARQFEVLHGLTRDATRLEDTLTDQSAAIPSEAIPYIQRFFELTESMPTAST